MSKLSNQAIGTKDTVLSSEPVSKSYNKNGILDPFVNFFHQNLRTFTFRKYFHQNLRSFTFCRYFPFYSEGMTLTKKNHVSPLQGISCNSMSQLHKCIHSIIQRVRYAIVKQSHPREQPNWVDFQGGDVIAAQITLYICTELVIQTCCCCYPDPIKS